MWITRTAVASRVALGVAALFDSAWVAVFLVPTGLRWPWLSFSDAEADGRPWAWLFRTCFLVADGLAVGVGVGQALLTTRTSRADRRLAPAWAALAVFGLASAIDDIAGLTCVAGVDAGCRTTVVPVHWVDRLHSLASAIAVLAVLGSMVAVLLARYRGGWPTPLVGGWLACELASTAAVSACYLWQGPMALPQAFEMVVESSWLAMMGRYTSPVGRPSLPGYPNHEVRRYRSPR